jgi:hypothetical protein
MNEATQITVSPPAMKSQDFAYLREEGMKMLRSIAATSWTDHNVHDPGITLLEAMCYAMTEMGLRSGMDMRDLVASDVSGRKQEFFTAGEILPVSPIAVRDIRKVLIDHPLVQNAWVFLLDTDPGGKYSILLEFEDETLNSSTFQVVVTPPALLRDYNIDLAFPYWDDEDARPFSENVTFTGIVFEGTPGNEWNQIEGSDAYFARITIQYTPLVGPATSQLLWLVAEVTTPMGNPLTELPLILPELTATVLSLVDNSPADPALIRKFNHRTRDANSAMRVVRRYLKDYRNCCEDFADFKAVRLQEVAVSAIIDINPGVNIESLLADIFFSIDGFITPVNRFDSLDDRLAETTPDEIFEGPSLDSGFLQDESLSATTLTEVLYTSDILRLILQQRDQRGTDIVQREDVNARNIAAVRNLSIANYLDNRLITSNARDCLHLVASQRHVPRLSLTKSRIIFFRNEVEVRYNLAHVIDRFNQKKADLLLEESAAFADIELPEGIGYPVNDYYPVQNDLPLIYGIGEAGLPETATEERKALALQLKGYLFFFEQLTAGIASQLGNINSFFSADPEIEKTLFPHPLYDIPQVQYLFQSFNPLTDNWTAFRENKNNAYITSLQKAGESREQFLTRRNRVLNHLLAVYGEDMYDAAALAYLRAAVVPGAAALPLNLLLEQQAAQRNTASRQLIRKKSAFFYDLPALNRDRAQAYGNPSWRNEGLSTIQTVSGGFSWTLQNPTGTILLRSVVPAASERACQKLIAEIFSLATMPANYFTRAEGGGQLRLVIKRNPADVTELAESVTLFNSPALATAGITAMSQTIVQLWVSFALIPLETRLYHILGVALKERRQLLHNVNDYFEIFNNPPPIRKRFRMWETPGFGGTQLLSGEIDYTGASNALAIAAAEEGIRTAISRGVHIENYDIVNPAPGVFQVVLLLQDNTVLARSGNFASRDLAKEGLFRIWQHVFRYFSSEGFYLVEHLFLYSDQTGDVALINNETDEPYSFQVSFILPSGYARNFAVPGSAKQPVFPESYSDPEFRKYTEQQIRKACPAHIMPRILWADRAMTGTPVTPADPSFDNFEQRYRAWLAAYLADGAPAAVLGPLRNQLVTVLNNIYNDMAS